MIRSPVKSPTKGNGKTTKEKENVTHAKVSFANLNPRIPDSDDAQCAIEGKIGAEKRLHLEYWRLYARRSILERLDDWLTKGIAQQICSTSIRVKDGVKIIFTGGSWLEPRITPAEATQAELTYAAALRISVSLQVKGEVTMTKPREISIPIGLGCRLCLTRKAKTLDELEALGVCRYDPLCTFIINGMPKLVRMQKQLRSCRPVVYTGPRHPYVVEGQDTVALQVRMKYNRPIGTGMVYSEVNREGRIVVFLPFFERKVETEKDVGKIKGSITMPLFSIIRLYNRFFLGDENGKYRIMAREDHLNAILRFIDPKHHKKVTAALLPSLTHILGSNERDEEVGIENDLKYYREESKIQKSDAILEDIFIEGFENAFLTYIKPKYNIGSDKPYNNYRQERYDTFCLMNARLAEVMAGVREQDDRNAWEHNEITDIAAHYKRLFGAIWAQKIAKIQREIEKSRDDAFNIVMSHLGDQKISSAIFKCFADGAWGPTEKSKKKNISAPPKKLNPMALWADVLRVNTEVGDKSPDVMTRAVVPDALGFISATDTPESSRCGHVNSVTIGLAISREHDDQEIRRRLHSHLREDGEISVILNGAVLGKSSSNLEDIARGWKRSGDYPELSIVREAETKLLWLYTEGRRPMRPLFIVKDGKKLLIDEYFEEVKDNTGKVLRRVSGWELSFDKLKAKGLIEMIDPFEQHYCTIAMKYMDLVGTEKQLAAFDNKIGILKMEIDKLKILLTGGNPTEKQRAEIEAIAKYSVVLEDISNLPAEEKARYNVSSYINAVTGKNATTDEWGKTAINRQIIERELKIIDIEKMKDRMGAFRYYTHADMNPRHILSPTESTVPFGEFNPAVRMGYDCKQAHQAIGTMSSVEHIALETTMKMMVYPTAGLVETEMSGVLGQRELPAQSTVTLAVMDYDAWPQEDSIVIRQSAVNKLAYWVKYTFSDQVGRTKEYVEKFAKPKLQPTDDPHMYDALNDDGIPMIGEIVRPKMAIIGKVQVYKDGTRKSVSKILGPKEIGYVEKVYVTNPGGDNMIVKVKIRQMRIPLVGDKFSFIPGQKATLSYIVPDEDMPFALNPNVPKIDVIMSPLAFTTRMTMGLLVEPLASAYAAMLGRRLDASMFNSYNQVEWEQLLRKHGFSPIGTYKLKRGDTGEEIEAMINVGPVALKELDKNVIDKFRNRPGKGKINPITRQPEKGQKREGGLKMGEMERDSLLGYGAGNLLFEKYLYASDLEKVPVCSACGEFAITKLKSDLARCNVCKSTRIGTIRIPHTFKNFKDEAATINFRLKFEVKETVQSILG